MGQNKKRDVILLQALVITDGQSAGGGDRTRGLHGADLRSGNWWPLGKWAEALQEGSGPDPAAEVLPAGTGLSPTGDAEQPAPPAANVARAEGGPAFDLWVNSLALGALATFLVTLLLLTV